MRANSILAWAAVAAFGAIGVGCGGPLRYAIHGTPRAPEADAVVVALIDEKAALTHLTVNTDHLAPPDRLQPGGTTYVIWARKNDSGAWTRVAALQYDVETRKGELKDATVPQTAFDLIISIEKQPTPESPSPDIVISQRVAN